MRTLAATTAAVALAAACALAGCDEDRSASGAALETTSLRPDVVARTAAAQPAPPASWDEVAARVRAHLDRAVRHAALAEPEAAVDAVDDAYYGTYEAPAHNLEVAVRQNVGLRRVAEVEDLFAQLREAVAGPTPPDALARLADRVAAAVDEDARSVTELGVVLTPPVTATNDTPASPEETGQ